jgi:hypothetical protein
LYPDDVPRFSVPEWNQYIDALEELNDAARRAQRR